MMFMPRIFEISFPAHPDVIDARRIAINKICFMYPVIIKNEIEFMHAKLEGIKPEDEEALL